VILTFGLAIIKTQINVLRLALISDDIVLNSIHVQAWQKLTLKGPSSAKAEMSIPSYPS
jgi:hypothetical protein